MLEKVLGADLPASTGNSNSSQNNSQSDANSEGSQVPAEERIELLCNDVVGFSVKDMISVGLISHCCFLFLDLRPQHGPPDGAVFHLEAIVRSHVPLSNKVKLGF